MPNTAYESFGMGRSERFTARVQWMLEKYAVYVLGTSTDARKLNLCARIQSDSGGMGGKIALSLSTNDLVKDTVTGSGATLDSSLTDAQLQPIMEGMFNSGVWDNIV